MAKNWMAYEAAEAVMGNNVEEIAEVGSRYPLFTRTVSMANSEYVLGLLKAIPKVTARVVETGLKDINDIDDVETESECVEEKDEAPKESAKKETKATRKPKPKSKQAFEDEADDDEADDDEAVEEGAGEDDYESMTAKALYKLCCDRAISSQCKKRDKASLIAVLKANDGKANEDENEEETDPYAGKSAKELFKMCSDRGIKTKTKQSADAYVKLLKKADEAEAETEDEEDDDDDWEI